MILNGRSAQVWFGLKHSGLFRALPSLNISGPSRFLTRRISLLDWSTLFSLFCQFKLGGQLASSRQVLQLSAWRDSARWVYLHLEINDLPTSWNGENMDTCVKGL